MVSNQLTWNFIFNQVKGGHWERARVLKLLCRRKRRGWREPASGEVKRVGLRTQRACCGHKEVDLFKTYTWLICHLLVIKWLCDFCSIFLGNHAESAWGFSHSQNFPVFLGTPIPASLFPLPTGSWGEGSWIWAAAGQASSIPCEREIQRELLS